MRERDAGKGILLVEHFSVSFTRRKGWRGVTMLPVIKDLSLKLVQVNW